MASTMFAELRLLFRPDRPSQLPQGRLVTLEAGRFVAAATVMLSHYSGVVEKARGTPVFDNSFAILHFGVPYFFVLSGFVMYHVHRTDIGRAGSIPGYARKRAVRLLPMFWAVSLIMLMGFLFSPALAEERQLSVGGLVADFLLLPHADAVLAISWTLRHEVVFYSLFAVVLWQGPRALWLIAAWIAVSFVGVPWGHVARLGSESILASSFNLGFGLGIVIAAMLHRHPPAYPGRSVAVAGFALATMLVLEWLFTRHGNSSHVGFGLAGAVVYLVLSAVLIHGLVAMERTWRVPGAAMWKALGGSSYLLYLIHQPLASLALRAVKPLGRISSGAEFLLLAVLAIIVALALHLTVERWVLRRLVFLRHKAEVSPGTNLARDNNPLSTR